MNVLSLFDGMSCGRIALDRAGIEVDAYYASEVDKYAIKVTQANWPDTVQLGDVTKWREWDIDWGGIDLLIGGSPCQGFSFAGKQLAFDDHRSRLFFVYVDILNHIRGVNPDVKFMLENVKMKKEHLAVISEQLGVEPVFINSALLSAQNRQRYYWANWEFGQPEDKGIVLADVIDGAVCSFLTPRGNNLGGVRSINGKTGSVSSSSWEHNNFVIVQKGSPTKPKKNQLKAGCYTAGGNSCGNHSQTDCILFDGAEIWTTPTGKLDVLKTNGARRYTVNEVERLQTVDIDYTRGVSDAQRYRMLGNGWTVDVIAHIFKGLLKPTQP
jgi:site-specific DNA-cytosine methylase